MSGHQETNPHFVPPPPRRQRTLRHKQYEYPQQMPMPMPTTPHSPPPPPHHRQQYPSSPAPDHHDHVHVPPPQRPSQTPQLSRGRRLQENNDHDHDHDHFPLHPRPPPQAQLLPSSYTTHEPEPEPGPDHLRLSHYPPPLPRRSPDVPASPPPYSYSSSSTIRVPQGHKTKPHTWLIGAFCAIFWIAIVLGGLVVLVVYLLFRPRSPKFDIADATLNAAYLDMGYLLNADMTILANFTNPSKKATVDFTYMYVNLYFDRILISTTYVEPFKEMKAVSAFRTIHLVTSQVGLPLTARQKMTQQIEGNRIRFQVEASLRTRSNLGSLFRYKYWLFGHCLIELTGPPSGVLVGKLCVTKR